MGGNITAPFFVINPKSFLYGEKLMELAREADKIAETADIDILFTAPFTKLESIAKNCPNVIVTAQHMDAIRPGKAMGKNSAESLAEIGVQVIVLNHADAPLSLTVLNKTIKRAKETGLKALVCADSVEEARSISFLDPDIVLAEPTELIGKTQTSSREYVKSTIECIKQVNPTILVEQGAGIRTEKDVRELLELGADGIGVTSGIIKAGDPVKMMKKMIETAVEFKKERILNNDSI